MYMDSLLAFSKIVYILYQVRSSYSIHSQTEKKSLQYATNCHRVSHTLQPQATFTRLRLRFNKRTFHPFRFQK